MSLVKTGFSLFLFAVCLQGFSQKLKKGDKQIVENLKQHIYYLADDKLEGRRAGSNGEKLAMNYISDQFKAIGLAPKGTDGYFQPFDINEGKEIGAATSCKLGTVTLQAGKEFFPLAFSASKAVEATPAIALQEADMPWFVDLAEILEENKTNPHFDLEDYIRKNAKKAADRGATAILLYNTSGNPDNLSFNPKDRSEISPIPVIYFPATTTGTYLKDRTASVELKLRVEIGEKKRLGHNVVGFIDNKAPYTVILGAHFDHLGYGEDGNSMLRTGEKLIHNGADDNASGTAALIELARLLKSSRSKNNNYLFIAFSGEELGLFGSKYYTEHPTIDLSGVNYMINMDMVGRLNDSTRTLSVGGYGTSPAWAQVIASQERKSYFVVKTDSSGTGPSDHTSFYRKDIPVLFFFTGQHKDYHRPSDDADRINYLGELKVVGLVETIVLNLDRQNQKLAFLKTRESQTASRSFRVTMGIMPDYTFDGTGVRADGVTEGKPAARAGIRAGDVIVQLGSFPINSMDSYMQALGRFQTGEKTKVKVKRGTETVEMDVQF